MEKQIKILGAAKQLQADAGAASSSEMLKALSQGLGVTAIGLCIAGYVLYDRESERPGQEIVKAARADEAAANAELARLSERPKLPPLVTQWLSLTSRVRVGCDLDVTPTPVTGGQTAGQGYYNGKAKAWHGTLDGPALQVYACARIIASEYTVVIGSISSAGDSAHLQFSLLGSTNRPI